MEDGKPKNLDLFRTDQIFSTKDNVFKDTAKSNTNVVLSIVYSDESKSQIALILDDMTLVVIFSYLDLESNSPKKTIACRMSCFKNSEQRIRGMSFDKNGHYLLCVAHSGKAIFELPIFILEGERTFGEYAVDVSINGKRRIGQINVNKIDLTKQTSKLIESAKTEKIPNHVTSASWWSPALGDNYAIIALQTMIFIVNINRDQEELVVDLMNIEKFRKSGGFIESIEVIDIIGDSHEMEGNIFIRTTNGGIWTMRLEIIFQEDNKETIRYIFDHADENWAQLEMPRFLKASRKTKIPTSTVLIKEPSSYRVGSFFEPSKFRVFALGTSAPVEPLSDLRLFKLKANTVFHSTDRFLFVFEEINNNGNNKKKNTQSGFQLSLVSKLIAGELSFKKARLYRPDQSILQHVKFANQKLLGVFSGPKAILQEDFEVESVIVITESDVFRIHPMRTHVNMFIDIMAKDLDACLHRKTSALSYSEALSYLAPSYSFGRSVGLNPMEIFLKKADEYITNADTYAVRKAIVLFRAARTPIGHLLYQLAADGCRRYDLCVEELLSELRSGSRWLTKELDFPNLCVHFLTQNVKYAEKFHEKEERLKRRNKALDEESKDDETLSAEMKHIQDGKDTMSNTFTEWIHTPIEARRLLQEYLITNTQYDLLRAVDELLDGGCLYECVLAAHSCERMKRNSNSSSRIEAVPEDCLVETLTRIFNSGQIGLPAQAVALLKENGKSSRLLELFEGCMFRCLPWDLQFEVARDLPWFWQSKAQSWMLRVMGGLSDRSLLSLLEMLLERVGGRLDGDGLPVLPVSLLEFPPADKESTSEFLQPVELVFACSLALLRKLRNQFDPKGIENDMQSLMRPKNDGKSSPLSGIGLLLEASPPNNSSTSPIIAGKKVPTTTINNNNSSNNNINQGSLYSKLRRTMSPNVHRRKSLLPKYNEDQNQPKMLYRTHSSSGFEMPDNDFDDVCIPRAADLRKKLGTLLEKYLPLYRPASMIRRCIHWGEWVCAGHICGALGDNGPAVHAHLKHYSMKLERFRKNCVGVPEYLWDLQDSDILDPNRLKNIIEKQDNNENTKEKEDLSSSNAIVYASASTFTQLPRATRSRKSLTSSTALGTYSYSSNDIKNLGHFTPPPPPTISPPPKSLYGRTRNPSKENGNSVSGVGGMRRNSNSSPSLLPSSFDESHEEWTLNSRSISIKKGDGNHIITPNDNKNNNSIKLKQQQHKDEDRQISDNESDINNDYGFDHNTGMPEMNTSHFSITPFSSPSLEPKIDSQDSTNLNNATNEGTVTNTSKPNSPVIDKITTPSAENFGEKIACGSISSKNDHQHQAFAKPFNALSSDEGFGMIDDLADDLDRFLEMDISDDNDDEDNIPYHETSENTNLGSSDDDGENDSFRTSLLGSELSGEAEPSPLNMKLLPFPTKLAVRQRKQMRRHSLPISLSFNMNQVQNERIPFDWLREICTFTCDLLEKFILKQPYMIPEAIGGIMLTVLVFWKKEKLPTWFLEQYFINKDRFGFLGPTLSMILFEHEDYIEDDFSNIRRDTSITSMRDSISNTQPQKKLFLEKMKKCLLLLDNPFLQESSFDEMIKLTREIHFSTEFLAKLYCKFWVKHSEDF